MSAPVNDTRDGLKMNGLTSPRFCLSNRVRKTQSNRASVHLRDELLFLGPGNPLVRRDQVPRRIDKAHRRLVTCDIASACLNNRSNVDRQAMFGECILNDGSLTVYFDRIHTFTTTVH